MSARGHQAMEPMSSVPASKMPASTGPTWIAIMTNGRAPQAPRKTRPLHGRGRSPLQQMSKTNRATEVAVGHPHASPSRKAMRKAPRSPTAASTRLMVAFFSIGAPYLSTAVERSIQMPRSGWMSWGFGYQPFTYGLTMLLTT